jgi:outer membrane protein assembly factor BamB
VARGRAVGRFEAALGLIGLIALGATYFLVSGKNPLPQMGTAVQGWLAHAGSLSTPEPAWRVRLDDQPKSGTVVGSAVVFATGSGVEVRDAGDGKALWSRPARWVAVAGDTVLLGKGRTDGYDAVDPVSGTARWHSAGLGVWIYRDALLSLECPAHKDCALSRRSTADGDARWTVTVPAGAGSLTGPHVSGDALPALFGLPAEDDRVDVVDTGSGAKLREEPRDRGVLVNVLGGRIIRSTAVRRDENCKYSIEARDAAGGRTVWKKTGYGLGTGSAAGCRQGRSPVGVGAALVTVRSDNRPAILATADGREVWLGEAGESVLVVDGQGAVVRSADHKSISLIDLDSGDRAWTHRVSGEVTLAPNAVIVAGTDTGRLIGYDRAGGATLLDVATQAEVVGAGRSGVVLSLDRTVGVLPFRHS